MLNCLNYAEDIQSDDKASIVTLTNSCTIMRLTILHRIFRFSLDFQQSFLLLTHTIRVFFAILLFPIVPIVSYGQNHIEVNEFYEGMKTGTLYDSGGVAIFIDEEEYDGCPDLGIEIYSCGFTFRNFNPYPIVLKTYKLYAEVIETQGGHIACNLRSGSFMSVGNMDTIQAQSKKTITIYGENTDNSDACRFKVIFDGFIPLKYH